MKIFTRLAALSTVAFAAACGEPPDDTRSQEQVISGFYQQHLKTHSPGIPGADELKQLQPFVSQALFKLLSQASETEAKYHAAATEPVPPLIDGDLFTSLFEGATSFKLDSCESEDNRASCHVRFTHAGGNGGDDEKWKDKLLLVKENNQWRIDDIEFLGSGQSSQREYLSDTLSSIVNEYN
ncbi:DUF3828 domain-containing protein [Herbaspirillum sp. RV1423]|uniref:DUF3828 domain-containing protein n=1 Tax=Herbaspirillum sp. RV1423 TaxID=1443993 RepID=UPI0004B594A8|nr:DUF3828 domain-containing protein [Herbaspirillum sp. RV1423]